MASIASEKFGKNARVVNDRFEDWPPTERTELIVAFNAWHWVEPDKSVSLALQPSRFPLADRWPWYRLT